mmetsp:Transcript_6374/g.9373  ORF Transcript_6374/g.9373 Transcript_6374/m.9373 type:complete len:1657 (-) Transcript_6374:302-5272(-)
MHYERDNNRVRCGPGCHWSDLIKKLNAYGKAPRTMQSYCSFSVGGTLAVNAHGITTDYCFAESVLEFRLARITSNGEAEVVVCCPKLSSEGNSKGQISSLNSDLFGLALGGYGLFGVITEVLLKVEDNVQLELDTMHLKVQPSNDVHEDSPTSEFVRIYDNCRNSIANKTRNSEDGDEDDSAGLGKVELKLARLNTVNLESASFYVFRRCYSSPTVSKLPVEPRELSPASRLLYKWAMPLLKEFRYQKEENSGNALDWGQEDGASRNQLLFESAVPISRLYNPLVTKDDTFVLQEFFCPHDKFLQWIDAVKPIYKDIEEQQKTYKHELILLNTTIRYVEKDDITFLSYSQVPGGVFAFVLYYRINRNEAAEKRLGDFHNRLAEVTVSMGGTFYLPYRKCYSPKLLKAAYPMIDKFAEMKELLDPHCVFSNLWFEHYVLPLCSPTYRKKWTCMNHSQEDNAGFAASIPQILATRRDKKRIILTKDEFLRELPRRNQKDILRRKNSYRNLLRSKELRFQFREQFLVQIFNLADPDEVMRIMARAAWDPANNSDIEIYKCIHHYFHGSKGENSLNLASLPRFWRGIQQLRQQKEELTRQTLSVISKLGMIGKIRNYVCVGDNGKTVKEFANELDITGKLWVVHNKVYPIDTLPPIEVVLERGSIESVAHEELAYDYISDMASEKLHKITSGSVDLVTINQGLHHIPLENLFGFLTEVLRMLKPGGLFIIREHDLKLTSTENSGDGKAPYPMLDLAHSVFNAVTGVTVKDEMEEIRAFRSVLEWRKILESVGFEDTFVYEVEDGDPTWDEMLCFCKPSAPSSIPPTLTLTEEEKNESEQRRLDDVYSEPPIVGLVSTLLSQVPEFVASNVSRLLKYLSRFLPTVKNRLLDTVLVTIPNIIAQNEFFGSQSRDIAKQISNILEPIITSFFRQTLGFVNGSLDLISDSEVKTIFNFKNLVRTTEFYLLLPYFQRKVQLTPDNASEMEKKIICLIEEYVPSLLPQKLSENSDEISFASGNRNTSCNGSDHEECELTASEVQAFLMELGGTLPSIFDIESIMLQSGFSLSQQASLVGQFGGNDISSASAKLAGHLDRRTWVKLKANLAAAVATGDLPTKSLLLDTGTKNHPWHSSLKTFISSPKVRLNEKSLFGLRLIGLGEVGSIYRAAKKDAEVEQAQPSFRSRYDNDIISHLKSVDLSIHKMNRIWADDIVERTITYTTTNQENSLFDVAEVIEAKFGYNSITSRKVDVTKQLQSLHASIHADLANPEKKSRVPDGAQIGWLPIDEGLLIEIRNKGNRRRESTDVFRKSLVNVATLGAAGNYQLKITYRRLSIRPNRASASQCSALSPLDSGHFDSLKLVSKNLCAFMESKNIVCADLHPPNDGVYTWFKLNEWMQVEILDELVKSLEHSPWYRFPFIEFMQTYFKVFRQQCNIIEEKYGIIQAYASMPFLVDLVPGIVMTLLFLQLKLFAIPLQTAFPDGYDNDKSRFLEEVVLHLPLNLDDASDLDGYLKSDLDDRIIKATPLPNNFMICSTPPFKAMGEILEKIAILFPSARVFQISNQFEVQVRVSLEHSQSGQPAIEAQGQNEADLQMILLTPGVKLKMTYHYPSTKKGHVHTDSFHLPSKTYYCLEVHCLALLDVFRTCNSLPSHKVEQVYDFWN